MAASSGFFLLSGGNANGVHVEINLPISHGHEIKFGHDYYRFNGASQKFVQYNRDQFESVRQIGWPIACAKGDDETTVIELPKHWIKDGTRWTSPKGFTYQWSESEGKFIHVRDDRAERMLRQTHSKMAAAEASQEPMIHPPDQIITNNPELNKILTDPFQLQEHEEAKTEIERLRQLVEKQQATIEENRRDGLKEMGRRDMLHGFVTQLLDRLQNKPQIQRLATAGMTTGSMFFPVKELPTPRVIWPQNINVLDAGVAIPKSLFADDSKVESGKKVDPNYMTMDEVIAHSKDHPGASYRHTWGQWAGGQPCASNVGHAMNIRGSGTVNPMAHYETPKQPTLQAHYLEPTGWTKGPTINTNGHPVVFSGSEPIPTTPGYTYYPAVGGEADKELISHLGEPAENELWFHSNGKDIYIIEQNAKKWYSHRATADAVVSEAAHSEVVSAGVDMASGPDRSTITIENYSETDGKIHRKYDYFDSTNVVNVQNLIKAAAVVCQIQKWISDREELCGEPNARIEYTSRELQIHIGDFEVWSDYDNDEDLTLEYCKYQFLRQLRLTADPFMDEAKESEKRFGSNTNGPDDGKK